VLLNSYKRIKGRTERNTKNPHINTADKEKRIHSRRAIGIPEFLRSLEVAGSENEDLSSRIVETRGFGWIG